MNLLNRYWWQILILSLTVSGAIVLFKLLTTEKNTTVNYTTFVEEDDSSIRTTSENLRIESKEITPPILSLEREIAETHFMIKEVNVDEKTEYAEPMEMITPTDIQSRKLYEAEQEIVKQCMNERGFDYVANDYDTGSDLVGIGGPVEFGLPDEAKERGYGIVEGLSADASIDTQESVYTGTGINLSLIQIDRNDVVVNNLSPEQQSAWTEALIGAFDPAVSGSIVEIETPMLEVISWDANSCLSAARRTIYGSDIKYMEDIVSAETLNDEVWNIISESSKYNNAIENWRKCMMSNGYDYNYPGQAAEILSEYFFQGEMTMEELAEKEIEIATVDALCYKSNAVSEMLAVVEKQAVHHVFGENAELFAKLRDSILNSTKTASQYVQ